MFSSFNCFVGFWLEFLCHVLMPQYHCEPVLLSDYQAFLVRIFHFANLFVQTEKIYAFLLVCSNFFTNQLKPIMLPNFSFRLASCEQIHPVKNCLNIYSHGNGSIPQIYDQFIFSSSEVLLINSSHDSSSF